MIYLELLNDISIMKYCVWAGEGVSAIHYFLF